MKTLVIIPAHNEEETIGQVLDDINSNFPCKVIVVNDGSKDKTKQIALQKGATVCTHAINRGLGATLATGIKAALNENADIVVTFDADAQHEAKDIKILIQPILDGTADAVLGSRFLGRNELMPRIKRLGNWCLTAFTNILSGMDVTDSQTGLRAFDRKSAEKLIILCDRYDVASEIVFELGKWNLKVEEVPITALYDERSMTKGTNVRSGLEIFFGLMLKRLGVKK